MLGDKRNLVAIRGYEAWGAWLDEFAAHLGMPVTGAIDYSLRELAKRENYPPPPQRY